MDRWTWKAASAAALCAWLTAPASAGVSGAGGGTSTVTETVTTVSAPDQVTRRSAQVVLDYLSRIRGGATVENRESGRNHSFSREVTVAQAETASALASVTALLASDVNSIAGRTYQYSERSRADGSGQVLRWTRVDTTLDRVTSSAASQGTLTTSERAIVVGDPDHLAQAYVAQGSASYHVDATVTETRHLTETTTKAYDQVDYYQVNVTRVISPILLDLDGDGRFQASGGEWLPHPPRFDARQVALFDYHGNGFPVLTEWIGRGDGLLCVPKPDGSVDGTCLFGSTAGHDNGYEALAALDLDGDGRIEGGELAGLQVWQDLDGNAQAAPGELSRVEVLGITSLDLRHQDFASSFTRGGQTFKMVDWWPNVKELRKKKMGPS